MHAKNSISIDSEKSKVDNLHDYFRHFLKTFKLVCMGYPLTENRNVSIFIISRVKQFGSIKSNKMNGSRTKNKGSFL